jgi:hypothetical protein
MLVISRVWGAQLHGGAHVYTHILGITYLTPDAFRGRGRQKRKRQGCGPRLPVSSEQLLSEDYPIHCLLYTHIHSMFGPFKATSSLLGGLLWCVCPVLPIISTFVMLTFSHRKVPWRLSRPRKYRQRLRLKRVDKIVSIVDTALQKQGMQLKAVERWKAEMPSEAEMLPKDKYTVFDRKQRGYRKGIHSTGQHLTLNMLEPGLTSSCRGAEVDEDQSESQSAWVLIVGLSICTGISWRYGSRVTTTTVPLNHMIASIPRERDVQG